MSVIPGMLSFPAYLWEGIRHLLGNRPNTKPWRFIIYKLLACQRPHHQLPLARKAFGN